MENRKIIVPDTCVILADSDCLRAFGKNKVVVGLPVIIELDHFKKGHDSKNFHARRFLKELDVLPKEKLHNGGASLGPNYGTVKVMLKQPYKSVIWKNLLEDNPDHQLINLCFVLQKDNPGHQVVLVTKDVNLRIKAGALGVLAEDYKTDIVDKEAVEYSGMKTVTETPEKIIDELHVKKVVDCPKTFLKKYSFVENEFLILKKGNKSVLGQYRNQQLVRVNKDELKPFGIKPKNAEQGFAVAACLDPRITLVTLAGPAGTGKTLLAIASALEIIKRDNKDSMSLTFTRMNVEIGRDLGMLPGDIADKYGPFSAPLFDNLGVLKDINATQNSKIKSLLDNDRIISTPLNYVRGRSIRKTVMLVDEAQNLTLHEVKTIITRAGANTKVILTGDRGQIDVPYLDQYSNGLAHTIQRAKGYPNYAHVELVQSERSALAEMANKIFS